jgi:streptogramin lyase
MRLAALLASFAAHLLGCADATCIDRDLDGLGEGCAMGLDCDDDNASRGVDCERVPPPDCAADPTETGCPCLAGTVADCFPGPDSAFDVGVCQPGRARCIAGHFNVCTGSVAPRAEGCDGLDQDCDGRTDEGVLSPCGGCDSSCGGGVWGSAANPFVIEGAMPTGSLELTSAGALTLTRRVESTGTVWVPASDGAVVSRIDEDTLTETARYATGAAEPSRVAIDAQGDAWIATRAFEGQSTLIEIAGAPERCVDLDGSGAIETSRGPSEVLSFGADECVLRSLEVGGPLEVARAMAIDGDTGLDEASGGDVWVGFYEGQAIEEIDGFSGALLQRVATPGFAPYAAAFDPWGTLYFLSRDGQLARVDRGTSPASVEIIEVPIGCWLLYSMAIDRDGRLLLTGFSCDRSTLYDPSTGLYSGIATAESPRGAMVGADGRFWIAHTGAEVSAMSRGPLRVTTLVDLIGETHPIETVGIGVGRYVWAISREAGLSDTEDPGLATAIDPETGDIVASIPVGRGPHTQGDLTGIQRFDVARVGSLTYRFTGCDADAMTGWVAVHLAGDLGSDGAIALEARHGVDVASLEAAAFAPLAMLEAATGTFPVSYPEGGIVEVRVTLTAGARFGGPRLERVGVEWTCPGPD